MNSIPPNNGAWASFTNNNTAPPPAEDALALQGLNAPPPATVAGEASFSAVNDAAWPPVGAAPQAALVPSPILPDDDEGDSIVAVENPILPQHNPPAADHAIDAARQYCQLPQNPLATADSNDNVDNGGSSLKRDNDKIAMGDGDDIENSDDNKQPAKKVKLEESELDMKKNEASTIIKEVDGDSLKSLQKTATSSSGKKDRKEFTAAEKLHILSLLENPARDQQGISADFAPHPAKRLREKYKISKSSFHRWKQQKSRLIELVSREGMGDRKRDTKDLLIKVKGQLKMFVDENLLKGPEERLAITSPVIQAQSVKIRDSLLEQHEKAETEGLEKEGGGKTPEAFLSEEECSALRSFKVTKSWAGRVASSMGLLSCPRTRKKNMAKMVAESATLGNTAIKKEGGVEALDAADATLATASAMPTNDTSPTSQPPKVSLEQAKQNTVAYLISINPTTNTPVKPKKTRREFCALEKLHILQEMQHPTHPLKMEQICAKYFTSKSSVFRWKIQHNLGQLEAMVNTQGRGHCKRVAGDNLLKIKLELQKFIEENEASPPDRQVPISATVMQLQAQLARDKLLSQHEAAIAADPKNESLTKEEEFALRNFKASKGWARKTAARYEYGVAGGATACVEVGGKVVEGEEGGVIVDGVVFSNREHEHVGVGVVGGGEANNNEMPTVLEKRRREIIMPVDAVVVDKVVVDETANYAIDLGTPTVVFGGSSSTGAHRVVSVREGGGREMIMHAPPPADAVVDGEVFFQGMHDQGIVERGTVNHGSMEDHLGYEDAAVEEGPVLKAEQRCEVVNDMKDSVMETVDETAVGSVMGETASMANSEHLTWV